MVLLQNELREYRRQNEELRIILYSPPQPQVSDPNLFTPLESLTPYLRGLGGWGGWSTSHGGAWILLEISFTCLRQLLDNNTRAVRRWRIYYYSGHDSGHSVPETLYHQNRWPFNWGGGRGILVPVQGRGLGSAFCTGEYRMPRMKLEELRNQSERSHQWYSPKRDSVIMHQSVRTRVPKCWRQSPNG